MDRRAWQATVHRVTRVRHNLVAKPPPPRYTMRGTSVFNNYCLDNWIYIYKRRRKRRMKRGG